MAVVSAANLAVKFLLELVAITAIACWGASVGTGVKSVLLAIAMPGIAVVAWAVLAAPNSTWRLSDALRIPFELSVFAVAAFALGPAVSMLSAFLFAGVALLNAALLTALGDWQR